MDATYKGTNYESRDLEILDSELQDLLNDNRCCQLKQKILRLDFSMCQNFDVMQTVSVSELTNFSRKANQGPRVNGQLTSYLRIGIGIKLKNYTKLTIGFFCFF